VAYVVNRLAMMQVWRPGRGLSRPQTLGAVNQGGNIDLTVATGPNGRAVVAWGTQRDTGEPLSPWKVFASVRTRAVAHFSAAHLLDSGTLGVSGPYSDGKADVTVCIDADGFTMVAWSSERSDSAPVRVVVVDPSGHFQPVQELAPESSNLTLTDAPGVETVLQWQVSEWEGRFSLGQAVRPVGGASFAPAEVSTLRLGVIDGAELIDSATGG
jgi:hypothetical protein